MIEWYAGGIRLRFTFSFFALTGLVCTAGVTVQLRVLLIFLCSLMHECGHIAAMYAFGMRPETLTFCACGICLPENVLRGPKRERAVILLSGCAVNFISAGVSLLLGCAGMFAAVHIILGAFNLLPFRFFDGGRLYSELTGREVHTAVKLVSVLPLVSLGVYSFMIGKLPLSLIAAVIILIADAASLP